MSASDYATHCFSLWYRLHQSELLGKTDDEIVSLFAEYRESLGEGDE